MVRQKLGPFPISQGMLGRQRLSGALTPVVGRAIDQPLFVGVHAMPSISMFYGIVIYMYLMDDKQHHLPHIHARYQGLKASISLANGELLGGELPSAKLKLVQAWIEIHRESLLADWELAVSGETPYKIPPLQ